MSTQTTTALTVVQRAITALGYDNEKALTELAAGSKHLVAITNDDGYKQIHAARMMLKNSRVEIEKRGKTAREDATAFSKAVIAEEKRLIGLIEPEEKRLAAIQQAHDDRIEEERQAKIRAEEERSAAIEEGIAELRGCQTLTPSCGSALIAEHIADLEKLPTDVAFFEDRIQQAIDAKAGGLARLQSLLTAAQEHEREQKRIADERAELARLRAEQEARDKADRERRAVEEAAAKKKRDEETAIENERLRKEREAFEAEQAATRERQAAEDRRIAAERAELERQQREAREAEEARARAAAPPPAPEPTAVENLGAGLITHISDERPSFDEIVRAVAWQFETDEDTVRSWICENVVLASQEAA